MNTDNETITLGNIKIEKRKTDIMSNKKPITDPNDALLMANVYVDIFATATIWNYENEDRSDIDLLRWARANETYFRQFGEAMILLSDPEHYDARNIVCEGFESVRALQKFVKYKVYEFGAEDIMSFGSENYRFVASQV